MAGAQAEAVLLAVLGVEVLVSDFVVELLSEGLADAAGAAGEVDAVVPRLSLR